MVFFNLFALERVSSSRGWSQICLLVKYDLELLILPILPPTPPKGWDNWRVPPQLTAEAGISKTYHPASQNCGTHLPRNGV